MGRRAILLLSATATMVLVAAAAALAVSFTFTNAANNCAGPATNAADRLAMGGGNDICNGLGGGDQIFGDHGNDNIDGAGGNDYLFGGTGEDEVNGAIGNDYINVSDHVAGNDSVDCGPGTDRAVRDVDIAAGTADSLANCDGNFTDVPVAPGGP
jgi:Ca2+-binding RTX toxin-like protein